LVQGGVSLHLVVLEVCQRLDHKPGTGAAECDDEQRRVVKESESVYLKASS
jgi:hypothetical protein